VSRQERPRRRGRSSHPEAGGNDASIEWIRDRRRRQRAFGARSRAAVNWLEAVPALLAGLGWALIPGLTVGWIGGLRRGTLIGFAPLISMSVLAVSMTLIAIVHGSWNVLTAALASIVAASVVASVRRLLRAKASSGSLTEREPRAVAGCIVVGLAISADRRTADVGHRESADHLADLRCDLPSERRALHRRHR
jgi:Arsenite efflux pump ACR3 and related permeases